MMIEKYSIEFGNWKGTSKVSPFTEALRKVGKRKKLKKKWNHNENMLECCIIFYVDTGWRVNNDIDIFRETWSIY